ncbi:MULTISPECIES: hypothetical protein [Streptococcus]|jgi:hypothetical protein|uniref:hypothetical protein n=1 Tax=Streptococcus TaxID=1301 RepID=UPI001D07D37D|nr:hypothetical protein [Streptococcus gordonii]MCB6583559.1 hypothetical protein [Streptococcus gordonii]MCB7053572.1 hypothetical protein [Streptococcus gordonii]MCB7055583.1 hypothetical protein [Streptococcus gordonii]MCG4842559.1 hypothetical protein [Streptococcus gordonii]MCY7167271.1 hypothetical protein [Streptococcus gordonii]
MKHLVIVGHPKRQSEEIVISHKKYKISFDRIKQKEKNEDPFIWNDNFFYTFCHTNVSLSQDVRDWIKEGEDVYFIFVSKIQENNNNDILEIDTIIKAKELYEWPEKGQRDKESLPEIFKDEIKIYHLPSCYNGNLTEHNKIKLFTCIGDEKESFLPMEKNKGEAVDSYKPYTLDIEISKKLLQLITVENNSAYYVVKQTTPRLKDNQKEEIFKKVSNKIFEIIEKCKQDKTAHLKGKQIKKYYLGFRKEDNDKEKVKCENKTDFIELKT